MSSNIIVTNSDEVYILTLHRTFKIKILHLIKDLNDRLDSIIITRTRDITNMVNVKFNTNLTETTVQEIINRLNNGEMNELFHSFDIKQLLNHYMTSSVIDTKATLAHEITSEISREYFSNIWFIYQLSLYTFFMNDLRDFEIPGLLDNNSIYDFFYINYDQWYNDFVNHWATHHRTHPCAATRKNIDPGCMRCFVLDGMQKVARPICTNKNKQECTEEFPDGIYIGCGYTPKAKSGLCESCRESILLKDSETSLLTDDDKGIYDDPLMG
ncbi:unnamed protein product [Rotaria sp. Silwood2]|nr:unnamed protein product [Rotaria sp. Silwood2]